jgi:FKBP-type peptidyl-prolyl cis-trans isomerase
MAYGERGVGSDIGPNELLVYDIELVGIASAQH